MAPGRALLDEQGHDGWTKGRTQSLGPGKDFQRKRWPPCTQDSTPAVLRALLKGQVNDLIGTTGRGQGPLTRVLVWYLGPSWEQ